MSTWTPRAEVLAADCRQLGQAAAWINARAWMAGVTPEATGGLVGAALSLGASSAQVSAKPDCGPLDSDREMLEAAEDLSIGAAEMLRRARDLRQGAVRDHEAAVAFFCEPRIHRSAADITYYRRVIADCENAVEILDVLARRLAYASACLHRVPGDLESAFEAPYAMVRRGGVLPYEGTFLTAGARA